MRIKYLLIVFITVWCNVILAQDSKVDETVTQWESWDEVWLLNDDAQGNFQIEAYKPIFLTFTNYNNGINNIPTSENPINFNDISLGFTDQELKFQLSFKTRVWNNVFNSSVDLWAAYTQSSRWQIFNGAISRPFRETNYEPEIMAIIPTDYSLFGLKGTHIGVSFNHQSNGRANPFSRSWNRIIFEAGLEVKNLSVLIRPWIRLSEDAIEDDNPEILNYLGRGELVVDYHFGKFSWYSIVRHSLRFGDNSRGGFQSDLHWHVNSNLAFKLHTFHGYGESLLDYNYKVSMVGLGVLLN